MRNLMDRIMEACLVVTMVTLTVSLLVLVAILFNGVL